MRAEAAGWTGGYGAGVGCGVGRVHAASVQRRRAGSRDAWKCGFGPRVQCTWSGDSPRGLLIVHGEFELRVPRPALWQRRRVGHLEEDGKCRVHTVAFLGVQEESPAALAALEDRRVDPVAQSHVIHVHVPCTHVHVPFVLGARAQIASRMAVQASAAHSASPFSTRSVTSRVSSTEPRHSRIVGV